MKTRDDLYNSVLPQLQNPSPFKISLLFHHVYSLKLSNHFVFNSEEELNDLILFLNAVE